MYKFGILAFLTVGETAGLGKWGLLSHWESLFGSDTISKLQLFLL